MRTRRAQRGFTLLDVIGAAVIMSFGILALVNAIQFAYRVQSKAFGQATQWSVASTIVDVMNGLPFDCFDPAKGPSDPIKPGYTVTCGGSSYQFPTVADLVRRPYPGDDFDYSDWTYEVAVTPLSATDAWQRGDGTILRRLDIRVKSDVVDEEFTLVKVDLENAVP